MRHATPLMRRVRYAFRWLRASWRVGPSRAAWVLAYEDEEARA